MNELARRDPAQIFESSLKAMLKPMLNETEDFDSPIQKFYEGTTAFITGGSGFLGKQLIEKLCRATKISKVYVLLRSKKGKQIQQRLDQMLEDPVYDLVKQTCPDFASRIVPVAGDVAELRLGLGDEDWKRITEEVDVIFHMAATTRFDEALRMATLINIRGTREALTLGKECKNLKSFVYVSTAYAHACQDAIGSEVLEDFYKTPIDPNTMISAAESISDDRLNGITESFIKGWPNTYTYAKAVAEEAVKTMSDGLPICVLRPAIVICSYREPSPGWVDISNVFGASGIILGPGTGLMKVVFSSDSTRIGLIPVDHVNNAIIAAGRETALTKGEKIKIYNLSSSARNTILWGHLRATLEGVCMDYVSPKIVWLPGSSTTDRTWIFWILTWLLHYIPAYIIDGICWAIGKDQMFMKIYKKMSKMSLALSYFTTNDWTFIDDNAAKLYESLNKKDKIIFDFDVQKINWVEYMLTWCIGLRRYIIKDKLEGTMYARKKIKVFKILHYTLLPIYLYTLYKLVAFGVYLIMSFLSLFI